MKMITVAIVLLSVAFAAAGPAWDGLGVKWDINVFSWPEMQPRTVQDAINDGFELVGSGTCGGSNNYEGYAYYKGGDHTITLLFDVNGYIAGFQTGLWISEQERSGFPSSAQTPPLVLDGDTNERYVISAYFTDPSKICSTGRTLSEFENQGNGDSFYIQNGADDLIEVPYFEEDITSPWVLGLCFDTMGTHYWYDISPDMDCSTLFPVFLLYDDGYLKGFGWAFTGDLGSNYYEHPANDQFALFMETVPDCLLTFGDVSTLHVFLDAHSLDNLCWWPLG